MTTESSERLWLAHPALREMGEAHRRGVVLVGCGPAQIETVDIDQERSPERRRYVTSSEGFLLRFRQGLYRSYACPLHDGEKFRIFQIDQLLPVSTNFRTVAIRFGMRKLFKYLPAYVQKRCRRYFWSLCEEMTVISEAVNP